MDLSNLEIVDVADIVEEVEEDSEEIRQDDGKKGRGTDIHLEEFANFKDYISIKRVKCMQRYRSLCYAGYS